MVLTLRNDRVVEGRRGESAAEKKWEKVLPGKIMPPPPPPLFPPPKKGGCRRWKTNSRTLLLPKKNAGKKEVSEKETQFFSRKNRGKVDMKLRGRGNEAMLIIYTVGDP